MRTYRGGERAPSGIYCGLRSGEIHQFSAEETTLPGNPEARYVRVPVLLVLVAGPLTGLAFVVFLPLVGIIGLLAFLVHRTVRMTLSAARATGRREREQMPVTHPAQPEQTPDQVTRVGGGGRLQVK